MLRKHKVIVVATSTVAASIIEDGRTGHSMFKIPLTCNADSVCNISLEYKIAHRLLHASLRIWHAIVMCLRFCIEALDRALEIIMKSQTFHSEGSQYDGMNALRLSEDIISISDADSIVFHQGRDQVSTIENPSISEFQSLYGLIPDRISCGTVTFNKKDIMTEIAPVSWDIDDVVRAFMMLLNQGDAFAVDTTFAPMLSMDICLKSIPDREMLPL